MRKKIKFDEGFLALALVPEIIVIIAIVVAVLIYFINI